MKKQVIKTALCALAAAIWFGLHSLAVYLVEMQYSAKVAPKQVEDDSAYTVLKTHHTVMDVIDYAYFGGFLVLVAIVILIWAKRPKPIANRI